MSDKEIQLTQQDDAKLEFCGGIRLSGPLANSHASRTVEECETKTSTCSTEIYMNSTGTKIWSPVILTGVPCFMPATFMVGDDNVKYSE